MKEIFKKLIVDFIDRDRKTLVPREYAIPVDSGKIVSLVGVRRSGKTSILFELIRELRTYTSRQRIVYINFEDDRLMSLNLEGMGALMDAYFELFPENYDKKIYLFLDEVQNVPGWETFVRRIYDTMNVSVFVTGSSSKLLATEIATALRGRTITYEIFPFSFSEYLAFRSIEVNPYSSRSAGFIKHALNDYLVHGGFAETIDASDDIRNRILSDYLNLIVYRDIVERYNIKNNALMKHLIRYCFSNMATLVSFTKMFNELKSQGFRLSKDTLYEYFSHLSDVYTLFSIPIFRSSIREEQRNPKKIYGVDNGFKGLFNAFLSKDYSKLYENAVFLQLRRHTKEIYYFKQKQEVDFVCEKGGQRGLFNVCYDLEGPTTRQREIRGLREAMEYFDCKTSILITRDKEETIAENGRTVSIIPLWKWLLAKGE